MLARQAVPGTVPAAVQRFIQNIDDLAGHGDPAHGAPHAKWHGARALSRPPWA